MSGLFRNIFTLIIALLSRRETDIRKGIVSHYWITPFDTGIRSLKSDQYFQLAEAAQLDFLVKTSLLARLLREGTGFVNVSQLAKFMKPVGMFQRVRVGTRIIYANEKCAYFAHAVFVHSTPCAEILVKMKFKRGAVTVTPGDLIKTSFSDKPAQILAWEQALEMMSVAPANQ
ncbi:thioesterase family protein [Undibacterium sp. TJN19]|uniref:thioesterase family protein n=1 Tax=Undibacterium sp. TJN19 TaxID=3413055 RepID=UPI003BF076B2